MICWGTPDTTFGLRSESLAVKERGAEMFSLWTQSGSEPDFEWQVKDVGDKYQVVPPTNYDVLDSEFELPTPPASDLDTALLNVEFQAVAVLVGRSQSPLHMHGALVVKDDIATGIIGGKESGKSTLSTYLWLNGWELLSDDGFLFEDNLMVRPVPRKIRLRADHGKFLPEFSKGLRLEREDGTVLLQPCKRKSPVKLENLVLLSPRDGELKSVDSARACLDFLIHTNSYRIHGINATIARLSKLLENISCFTLGRASLEKQLERLSTL